MSKFSTPFFKKSPLEGAYENAADGRAFMGGLVSGQQQFAKLQQDITKGFESFIAGEDYSENQADRIGKRMDKIDKKQGAGKGDGQALDDKRRKLKKRKESVDKEIEKQKKGKRSRNFLSATEKTDIVRNHYEDQGGKDWDIMSQEDKNLIIQDYKNIYGFN